MTTTKSSENAPTLILNFGIRSLSVRMWRFRGLHPQQGIGIVAVNINSEGRRCLDLRSLAAQQDRWS